MGKKDQPRTIPCGVCGGSGSVRVERASSRKGSGGTETVTEDCRACDGSGRLVR